MLHSIYSANKRPPSPKCSRKNKCAGLSRKRFEGCIMTNRETPLAEIVGHMSLSKNTDVSTQSWVFISVYKPVFFDGSMP